MTTPTVSNGKPRVNLDAKNAAPARAKVGGGEGVDPSRGADDTPLSGQAKGSSDQTGEDAQGAAPSSLPPIIIKKYANRRLYNTESSTYVTLDHLARLTREGRDFKVIDARSEEDITHTVLTQIIMDEESRGGALLPAGFLRQLISMYGDSMQSLVPHYLESSMNAFRRNQVQFNDAMKGALERSGPFGELAKRNLEMFEAAFVPRRTEVESPAHPTASEQPPEREELDQVKAQLAELQAKLDRLTR